jgi:putative ABC transport system permease protein
VAATLLVGGALTVQSFGRLGRIDLGFRPNDLITMELPLSPAKYAERTQQVQFMDQVLERVRALPGVTAGMTINVPMQRGVTLDSVFEVEGRPPANPSDVPITAHRLVSPGYTETLGVRLVAGRFLDAGDWAGSLPVAVVSEQLVRQAWPGEDAIGKRLRRRRAGQAGPWMTVVGVVKDVKEDRFAFRVPRAVWYVPYAQETFRLPVSVPLNLVVRAEGGRAGVLAAVREAVRAVDPQQPVAGVMPMQEYLADVLIAERFSAVLMATMAAIGLALAALGLYGVLAYSVNRRTAEIGLRMALGASHSSVVRLIVGQGAALIVIGLGLGLAGAWSGARLLSGVLYGVSPTDPPTFAIVTVALAGVALFACWLPARRAARISPMVALRSE